jgi:NitT/TauT family transport system substrate-binding protein
MMRANLSQSRRQFMKTISVAGAASILRLPTALAADGPPEITSVRLMQTPSICAAPQLIVGDLLRAEGFTDIRFVYKASNSALNEAIVRGEVDFSLHYAPEWVSFIDRGGPVTVVAGVHVGCFELFANGDIRSIGDLKGRTVGITALGSSEHLFVSVMAAYIGLDPARDIRWVTSGSSSPEDLFADGKVDACLGLPPVPQDLRARHIGHVVVNSSVDRPWSQYFCCMLAGNRDFVRKYPAAAMRVTRAILKAADLCATDPDRVARQLVDGKFTKRYDYAERALREIPYAWREYDAEDTVRYYALQLHDLNFIKSIPQEIIAEGTDWRFLDELKRELKA